jgi:DivIVA domain-containing protein
MTESRQTPAFATTRRGRAYDKAEVDAFVAELEEALRRSERKRNELEGEFNALRLKSHLAGPRQPDHRHETSVAAARLLEIATAEADHAASETRAEAEALLAAAREESARLLGAAQAEAARISDNLDERRRQHTAEIERQRTAALAEIAHHETAWEARLHRFARREANRNASLRGYLTEQLARLDLDPAVACEPITEEFCEQIPPRHLR